jgi:predicted nuclease of predicted toxin-antitoxin system
LSLELLIDEDAQDKILVKMLKKAGHDVLTVNEAGLASEEDSVVFGYARSTNRILLTLNCRDFEILHQANSNHPGIFAIYQEANPSKKMSFKAIVRAIPQGSASQRANLENANIPLANQFISLNQWNY